MGLKRVQCQPYVGQARWTRGAGSRSTHRSHPCSPPPAGAQRGALRHLGEPALSPPTCPLYLSPTPCPALRCTRVLNARRRSAGLMPCAAWRTRSHPELPCPAPPLPCTAPVPLYPKDYEDYIRALKAAYPDIYVRAQAAVLLASKPRHCQAVCVAPAGCVPRPARHPPTPAPRPALPRPPPPVAPSRRSSPLSLAWWTTTPCLWRLRGAPHRTQRCSR